MKKLALLLLLIDQSWAQSAPSWICGQYPADGATGVPTNASILLNLVSASVLPTPSAFLTASDGKPPVALNASFGPGLFSQVLPVASLFVFNPPSPFTPQTKYSVNVNPLVIGEAPYQFSFTTGSGPDNTGPVITGLDPPSGTTGLGLNAPITIHFNKPLKNLDHSFASLAAGGSTIGWTGGITGPDLSRIIVWPEYPNTAPGYQLKLDPTKATDAEGNSGQGAMVTGQYFTFLVTDFRGSVLGQHFPADGETAIPTNVSIRLLFQETVDLSSASSGITIDQNGTAVNFNSGSFSGGQGVWLRPAGLQPNQSCRVTVNQNLRDLNGLPVTGTASFQFQTSDGPDLVRTAALAVQPGAGEVMPLNGVVALKTNKRIIAVANPSMNAYPNERATLAIALSPDQQTLTLTPQRRLKSGVVYQPNLGDFVDDTGAAFLYSLPSGFQTGTGQDHQPPVVLATTPVDGAAGVPIDSNIEVRLDKGAGLSLGVDPIQLATGGQIVAGTISYDYTRQAITLKPNQSLAPNTQYSIVFAGIANVAGDQATIPAISFTTGANRGSPQPPSLISSSPANNDKLVDPNTAVVLNFDQALDGVLTSVLASIQNLTQPILPIEVNGSAVTVRPLDSWLANAPITLHITAVSVSSAQTTPTIQFETGPSADTTRPTVTSISPPDGSRISATNRTIALSFSKPIDPSSLTSSSITAYVDGGFASTLTVAADRRSVALALSGAGAGPTTVLATDGVRDLAGNRLVPFEARLMAGPPDSTSYLGVGVNEIRPISPFIPAPAATTITWFLGAPVNLADVEASLVILADGLPVPGRFELSVDRKVLQFFPSAPFSPGVFVSSYQYQPIISSGPEFFIATTPDVVAQSRSTPLSTPSSAASESPTILAAGPVAGSTGVPINDSIHVLFSQPIGRMTITPDTVRISIAGAPMLTIQTPTYDGLGLTVTPIAPLPCHSQMDVALIGLQGQDGLSLAGRTWSFRTGEHADFTAPNVILPTRGNVNYLPVNQPIRFVYDRPMDPYSAVASVVLTDQKGDPVSSYSSSISDDLRTVSMTLHEPLDATQMYSFRGDVGFDLAGMRVNPIPIYLYFYPGIAPDLTPPNLLAASPGDGQIGLPRNTNIILSFDKPVSRASLAGVKLTGPDGEVKLQLLNSEGYLAYDPQRMFLAPVKLLKANTTYQVVIAGVQDLSGNPLTTSLTSNFTTGAGITTGALIAYSMIPTPRPTNAPPLSIAFDAPLSPATVDSRSVTLGRKTSSELVPVPADVGLSADGTIVTIVPGSVLVAGQTYQISAGEVTDYAGNPYYLGDPSYAPSWTFTQGFVDDTTPPAVVVSPPDGSTDVPANAFIKGQFSKPVVIPLGATPMRLYKNGTLEEVVSTPYRTATSLTVSPFGGLDAGATYRLEVDSLSDLTGNVSAPVTSTFTVAASGDNSPFQLLSTSPANGDVGVPPTGPITRTYNRAVSPITSSSVAIQTSAGLPVAATYSFSGPSVIISPTQPLPDAATITVSTPGITDLSGVRSAAGSFSFKTGVIPDTTPPALVSAWPAPGTLIGLETATFILTFSKPVKITQDNFRVLQGAFPLASTVVYQSDPRSVQVTASNIGPAQTLTLLAPSGLPDEDGNLSLPLSIQYPTADSIPLLTFPFVASSTPAPGSTGVDPTTPISIHFNKTMDAPSVLSSVQATQNSQLITGALLMKDANLTVQFTPDVPYQAGSAIDYFVLPTAMDTLGLLLTQRYAASFQVGPAGPGPMTMIRKSFEDRVAPDSALDLRFDRDLEPATIQEDNVFLRCGRVPIVATVSRLDSRTIRVKPVPLVSGNRYVLTLGPQLAGQDGTRYIPREFTFLADASVPDAALQDIQFVGTEVHVRFSAKANGLETQRVDLRRPDGSIAPANVMYSPDGREWIFKVSEAADMRGLRIALDGVERARAQ